MFTCFVDISRYVGDESPQKDEDMEEAPKQPIRHRAIMPHRPDCRFHTELENSICDLFVREGVSLAQVREIRRDLDLCYIWNTLPYDMETWMHHVVNALMLI